MTTQLNDEPARVAFDPVESIPMEAPEGRSGWGELIRLALSTSGGQRLLMFWSGAILIVLLTSLYVGSLLIRGYLARAAAAGALTSVADAPSEGASGGGEAYEPEELEDITPDDLSKEGEGDPRTEPTATNEPETPEDVRIGTADAAPIIVSPPPFPFLPNPNVPEDASNNHPDATSNQRAFSVGFNQLTPGEQRWYRRRIEVELPAYLLAVKSARSALTLTYGGRSRRIQTASTLIGQLESAKNALKKERLSDDEVVKVVQALITSRDFLLAVNNSSGLRVPVPDFWERPNPEYARTRQEHSSEGPGNDSARLNEKGGFR
jgi:hypothetical protein